MHTIQPLWKCAILCVMALRLGIAQQMTDTSSTFHDMWFDDTTVYATGNGIARLSVEK